YCVLFVRDHLRHLHSFPTRRSSDLLPDFSSMRFDESSYACSWTHGGDCEPGPGTKVSRVTRSRSSRVNSVRSPLRSVRDLTLPADRKSTRLNSSHVKISYAVFCLKK